MIDGPCGAEGPGSHGVSGTREARQRLSAGGNRPPSAAPRGVGYLRTWGEDGAHGSRQKRKRGPIARHGRIRWLLAGKRGRGPTTPGSAVPFRRWLPPRPAAHCPATPPRVGDDVNKARGAACGAALRPCQGAAVACFRCPESHWPLQPSLGRRASPERWPPPSSTRHTLRIRSRVPTQRRRR